MKNGFPSHPRVISWFRIGVVCLVLLAAAGSSLAAITVNSTSSGMTTGATNLTWSHTVNSGSNRALFVGISMEDTGGLSTGVTYGGTAMTLVGRSAGTHTVEIWRLLAPTAGTANIVATFNSSRQVVGGAAAFDGVDQTTPTGTFAGAEGSGTTPSVAVSSAAGELVIDTLFGNDGPTATPGGGQTARWNLATGSGNGTARGAGSTEAGAASVTMSWTLSSSVEWGIGGVSIKPAVLATYTISGTVYEDANYGGGAGRSLASSGGVGQQNARVELYDGTGALSAVALTNASGLYAFPVPNGNYTVRVVSSSVTSSRTGYVATLLPIMTFRTNASSGTAVDVTDYVGGLDPATADAGNAAGGWILTPATGVFSGSGSGKAHAFAPVTVSGANVTGVDFGWNFDTIVNTNNTGQGSLRQFLTNANTLGGDASLAQSGLVAAKENAVFMISNGTAVAGLRATNNYFSGGMATISPASALPTISTPMVLNAQKQPGFAGTPIVRLDGAGAGGGGKRAFARERRHGQHGTRPDVDPVLQ